MHMNGANETIIDQRSFVGGPVFRFCERHLEYDGTQFAFKIKYEDIAGPAQYLRGATSDWLPRFACIYLLILALVLLETRAGQYPRYGIEGLRVVGAFGGIFIGILIAICGSLYYLTHKEFTIIPARNGNLLVVRDKQHDTIMEKLQTERLKSLRLLSAPDPANSPNEELAKLKWLQDEGAITEDEYRQLCPQSAA